MNNPINAIDPDGREVVFVIGGTRYRYDGSNLFNSKGTMVNPKSINGTHAGQIFSAYNIVGKLDKGLNKQIQTLVNSKNVHLIDTDARSYGGGSVKGGNEFESKKTDTDKIMKGISVGTNTTFNFNKEKAKGFEDRMGVPNSPETTVAHELRHQYDYETGNMADSHMEKSDNNDLGEKRAIGNENIVREKLNMSLRKDYEGKKGK